MFTSVLLPPWDRVRGASVFLFGGGVRNTVCPCTVVLREALLDKLANAQCVTRALFASTRAV